MFHSYFNEYAFDDIRRIINQNNISTVQYNYRNPKKTHNNMQQNSAEKYFIWSAFAGVLDILSSQKSAL